MRTLRLILPILVFQMIAVAAERGVLMRETPLYIQRDTKSERIMLAPRGYEVALLERSSEYLHVSVFVEEGEQTTGWMLDKGAIFPTTPNGDRVLFGEAVDSEDQASRRTGRKGAAKDAYRLYARLAEYFPASPLAGEALYRAADIRWQIQAADVTTRRSYKELPTSVRPQIDDEEMKNVIKKFPHTKWADLAEYHLLENKICGDWQAKPNCPEKESDLYEKYAQEHPQSPKAQEALLQAASRQAALIEIYKSNEEPGKIGGARQRALALAEKAASLKPDSDDAERAQRLIYMVQHEMPTFGNAAE